VYDLLEKNKREIGRIASRYGATDIRLFGSVAKRSATETSDRDFLVTLEPGRTFFDLGGRASELEQLIGRHGDVATRPILRKVMRERVEKEAIPV
jgi:hypothetical protein